MVSVAYKAMYKIVQMHLKEFAVNLPAEQQGGEDAETKW